MKKSSGFTLIEMLIASVIFALVGIAAYQILSAVIDSNKLSKDTTEQLVGVQRAFYLMERDFLQVSLRKVRIDGEKPTDKTFKGGELIMESEDGAVAFTHDGWRNPGLILDRSEIQSVAYRMVEGKLERLFFNFPDPVTGQLPKIQILLEGMESLKFEFFDNSEWVKTWDKSGLPKAVKVILGTEALGEIPRIFVLTDTSNAANARQ